MAADKFSFGIDPVSCHAWNKDRSQVAVSLNDHEVHIYSKGRDLNMRKKKTLSEHTQRVTSIDWAPKRNIIVTCGSDRNAHVWTLNGNNEWKPTLVILRINRAATCVKWSPEENKFAVGTGARLICVCHFDEEHDWWVSKHVKKPIRSTVTSIDWHPNNVLFAAGSTDFKARVFSGYIKDIEDKPSSTPWGAKMTFGNVMQEYGGGGGWVHSVCFDASGNRLAWVGHDSTVNIVNTSADVGVVQTIKTNLLPFLNCVWAGPTSLVVGGHDCELYMYTVDGTGKPTLGGKLAVEAKAKTGKLSAMAKFKQLDSKATTEQDTQKSSTHQNSITQLSIHTGAKEAVVKLTSTGADGLMVNWDYKKLESSAKGSKV
ncbi:LOW QUALITY PROTEIN: actin-related protein 2/3 complex subunit 1A-A-like [Amphiura filiformis]|uniref:LOW QUALITY PROTEIN: actin-related protein 2/3 complex subunit 1A-A-like n=1 Tax=Amphiura filiformis TaxID=82378 RepID=UPI003B224B36